MADLYKEAKEALIECETAEEKHTDTPDDPGYVNTFYNYPRGYAHSCVSILFQPNSLALLTLPFGGQHDRVLLCPDGCSIA